MSLVGICRSASWATLCKAVYAQLSKEEACGGASWLQWPPIGMCFFIGLRHSLLVGVLLSRCGVATHSMAVAGASSTWLGHGLSSRRDVACHVEVVVTFISHISKPLGWQVEVLANSTLLGANSSILLRVCLHPVYPGSLNASLSGTQQLGGCCW